MAKTKKSRKTTRAAVPPTKEFTAPMAKLREYLYNHRTLKAAARNIEVTEALSNHVGMMTSMTANFGAGAMISLVEPDMEEPLVPKPWGLAKDENCVSVKSEDCTSSAPTKMQRSLAWKSCST